MNFYNLRYYQNGPEPFHIEKGPSEESGGLEIVTGKQHKDTGGYERWQYHELCYEPTDQRSGIREIPARVQKE